MKKIVLFLALTMVLFATNSCSSDTNSNKATGVISFKVNGIQKTFRSFHFRQETTLQGTPDEHTTLYFITDGNENHDWVSFSFEKGILADVNDVFQYYSEGNLGYDKLDNFSIHKSSNGDDKKLVGTFSGDMISSAGTVTITDGSFDIKYY